MSRKESHHRACLAVSLSWVLLMSGALAWVEPTASATSPLVKDQATTSTSAEPLHDLAHRLTKSVMNSTDDATTTNATLPNSSTQSTDTSSVVGANDHQPTAGAPVSATSASRVHEQATSAHDRLPLGPRATGLRNNVSGGSVGSANGKDAANIDPGGQLGAAPGELPGAQPGAIPGGQPGALGSMGSVVQTLAALAMVLGLIFVLRWLLQKWSGQGGSGLLSRSGQVIEVLSRTTIASKSQVLVLRVGHRLIVTHESAQGMSTLATISDPDEIACVLEAVHSGKPGSVTGQFRQMLDHFNGTYEGQWHPSMPKTLTDLDDPGNDDTEIITDRSRNEVGNLLARLRRMNREIDPA